MYKCDIMNLTFSVDSDVYRHASQEQKEDIHLI